MSDIQNYFKNSTVFITGGTGFIGSLLVEKLLRTCKDLKQIYVLIRPKGNLTERERFETFFEGPVFYKIKNKYPEVLKKVILMPGDVTAPKLGLSNKNIEILNAEVNCIFHSAASLKFVEKLRNSFNSNVKPVQEIIKIARNIDNLTSLVYVSTAFTSNIYQSKELYEIFYDGVPYTSQQLEALLNHFDDELIEKIKANILTKCPNVYVLNKSIAEEVIRKNADGLPIAIVKPSMITSTYTDPFPGWINNYYGIISIFFTTLTGFIRVLLCESNYNCDFVPADYVVNLLMASAWDISNIKKNCNTEDKTKEQSSVRIYNCVNSIQNPISLGQSLNLMRKHYYDSPCSKPTENLFYMTTNAYLYNILRYGACIFPAYVKDLIHWQTSTPYKYSKIYSKQFEYLDIVQHALTTNWKFYDNNTQSLWKKLNQQDKMMYNFDLSKLDWDIYCKILVDGINAHLLQNKIKKHNGSVIKSRM